MSFDFSSCFSSGKPSSSQGSALFLILIAVVLFAALSYTVAGMMRSGGSEQSGTQKPGLLADEILTYGQQLRQGVQSLKISNGCQDAQISFEATGLAGYAHNPVASTRCSVFHQDGAGLGYNKPVAEFGSGSDWIFTGQLNVLGVGTDCASGESCTELLAILEGVNLNVCREINRKTGIVMTADAPPAQDGVVSFPKYTGTQTYSATITDQAGTDQLRGFAAGCTETSAGGSYFFYQTLVSR
ncbi:MAG: hypothetical protein IT559_08565 [Alphaproteobacteria bacterium]|nr:hypothetical protein [Alphaproteobacteria bacterium]